MGTKSIIKTLSEEYQQHAKEMNIEQLKSNPGTAFAAMNHYLDTLNEVGIKMVHTLNHPDMDDANNILLSQLNQFLGMVSHLSGIDRYALLSSIIGEVEAESIYSICRAEIPE